MKKMLYILNIANRVNSFSYTSMKAALKMGFEYHIAGNWGYSNDQERAADEKKYGIHIHQIDFVRVPFHPRNIKAYRQLKQIVVSEKFDVIHCNTPIGGVVGRILGKKNKINTVIYQAHGFHFFNGAPFLNWIVYYPIEKWLAKYTDILITINREDYECARHFKLKKGGRVFYVPGVGLEPSLYLPRNEIRSQKREELGLKNDDIVLISAGDLIKRKNYQVSIKAIAKAGNKKLQYYICGTGTEKNALKKLAKRMHVENQVHFLGFRSDIRDLYAAADIFLFSSLQEGLPRSLSEAMAAGLPCIVSKIRGNIDLIQDGKGGILCNADDVNAFSVAINKLSTDVDLRENMKVENLNRIKAFDIDASEQGLLAAYERIEQHGDLGVA